MLGEIGFPKYVLAGRCHQLHRRYGQGVELYNARSVIHVGSMADHRCHHEERGPEVTAHFRRVQWAVLVINGGMFPIEIGAGFAAGSASLQADALDFLGDAANYGISLFVVGMAIRYRARATLLKGISMGAFGQWVIGTAIWHLVAGTLPSTSTMGTIGVVALAANAVSFGLLWFYRSGTPT